MPSANKLIVRFTLPEIVPRITRAYSAGVLETPCYPAIYYAGPIVSFDQGEWIPMVNDTGNWHRTLKEAEDALLDYLIKGHQN